MRGSRFDDAEVRRRAFRFLDELKREHGRSLPRERLAEGFSLDGVRVPLLGPQGIFKPAVLDRIPISITTTPIKEGRDRPYDDELREDGFIGYRYRNPGRSHEVHPDNLGLRLAMANKTMLIYFFGLVPGWYTADYPVFIIGDDPVLRSFTVAVDDYALLPAEESGTVREDALTARRQYITRTTQQRMHQDGFRERVLRAYESCCAVCRLKHERLLDAAHILPDKHPLGEPWVHNGLALCKIHHAAYDQNILGISRDYKVAIRADILLEHDGPMLTHGLQELDGRTLMNVPRARAMQPKREFLDIRYEEFRASG
ncbi:MAG: HNH endonuclease [Candidatus Eisenbacteria bacterium]|nr:HNH endonuclease [Candidatus Eisenbacteria bacterium]